MLQVRLNKKQHMNSEEIKEIVKKANSSFANKDYKKALNFYLQVYQYIKEHPEYGGGEKEGGKTHVTHTESRETSTTHVYVVYDKPTLEDVLGKITTACLVTNNFSNTEKYFLEAIDLVKANKGEEHFDTTTAISKLGQYHHKTENYDKAKSCFSLSYEIRRKTLGNEDSYTLLAAEWLKASLTFLKEWEEAEKIGIDILDIQRKLLNKDDPKLFRLIKSLAGIYYALRKYPESEELYLEAIAIADKLYEVNSDKSLEMKFNLAKVYYHNDECTKAVDFLQKMLIDYQRHQVQTVAKIHNLLADNFYYIPDKNTAFEFHSREAIKIYEYELELDDIKILDLYYDLGFSYLIESKNYTKAEEAYNVILDRAENELPQNSKLVLGAIASLGEVYYDGFKNITKAEEFFQKAIKIISASDKDHEKKKLRIDYYLAQILIDKNERKKAETLLKETLETSIRIYGLKHDATINIRDVQLRNFPTSAYSMELAIKYKYNDASSCSYNKYVSDAFKADSKSKKIRVFLSSTFRDMMPEREYLIKNIFPKLKKLCRSKGLDFTEVDLRWGITESDAEQGKVIEICLNEIDKSRPFFIGMIGQRYGWIPPYESTSGFKRMLGNYNWIGKDIEDGLSVTEMEVQYGVLRNPEMKGNAFFYIRNDSIAPDDQDFHENKDSESYRKLVLLKENLLKQNAFPTIDYNSIEQLGDAIFDDLKQAIFSDESDTKKLTEIDEARDKQINFAKSFVDFYIPDRRAFKKVHHFISGWPNKFNLLFSQSNKLVLFGKMGIGKTALLANYIGSYYEDEKQIPLLFHFVEADEDIKKSGEIVKRIIDEINLISPTGIFLKDTNHQNPAAILEKVFNGFKKKIVIVIDGLEKIKSHDFFSSLNWVPKNIPTNVKLLFSTNKKEILDSLLKIGFKSFELESQPKKQREEFITSYLDKFGKKLPQDMVDVIVNDDISHLPFSLKLLLDELRIFGVFEELNDFIDNYLEAKNNKELFIKLFERMEGDYEDEIKGLVGRTLSFIALSKNGLTESEIVNFTQSAPLYWSPIYNSIENYLYRNIGQLSIRNEDFLEAVKEKYLTDEIQISTFHRVMADYFNSDEDKVRKFDELSYHLFKIAAFDELKEHLADIEIFMLYSRLNPNELIKYLDELKTHCDLAEIYKNAIIDYEQKPGVTPLDVSAACHKLGQLVSIGQDDKYKVLFAEKSFEMIEKEYGENHIETAKPLSTLIDSMINLQDDRVERYILKAIALLSECEIRDMRFVSLLSTMIQISMLMEEYDQAEVFIRDEIELLETIWGGESFALVDPYVKFADLSKIKGDYEDAIEYCEKAIQIVERFGGKDHMSMFMPLDMIVEIYKEQKLFDQALEAVNISIASKIKSYGDHHIAVLSSKVLKAAFLFELEKPEEAEPILLNNFELCKTHLGLDHKLTQANLGMLLKCFDMLSKPEEQEKYWKYYK